MRCACVLCVLFLTAVALAATNRPIIGVLTQPVSQWSSVLPGNAYIASSYVKWLEAAGAQVAPVLHNQTTDELLTLFDSINGLLLPGGGAPLTDSYTNALNTVWKYATSTSDYWLLHGTCQGFEQLCMLAANNDSILTPFDAENISMALNVVQTGRFLSALPAQDLFTLSHQAVTMNNHGYGTSPRAFNTQLSEQFAMLSTNNDREGKTFVSTMEHHTRPIYGTQWHPEKNQFEWNPSEVTPHDAASIEAMQSVAAFLVAEARRSSHSFSSDSAAQLALIYKNTAQLVYSFPLLLDFEECYVWNLTNV